VRATGHGARRNIRAHGQCQGLQATRTGSVQDKEFQDLGLLGSYARKTRVFFLSWHFLCDVLKRRSIL
jgi:hypothetical protein